MSNTTGKDNELEETHTLEYLQKRLSILCAQGLESQDKLSSKQPMDLPEGTYLISKDNSIINLPDPSPVCRTNEGDGTLNLSVANSDAALSQISAKMPETELNKDIKKTCENKAEYQTGPVFQDVTCPEDIAKLKAELISVKKLLEEEKHEKEMLAAKLELSINLLLRLYN